VPCHFLALSERITEDPKILVPNSKSRGESRVRLSGNREQTQLFTERRFEAGQGDLAHGRFRFSNHVRQRSLNLAAELDCKLFANSLPIWPGHAEISSWSD
jgi:hypothetical protein